MWNCLGTGLVALRWQATRAVPPISAGASAQGARSFLP